LRLPLTKVPAGTRQILAGVLEFEDRSPLTFGGKGFLVVGPKYNVLVDTPACTPRVIQAVRACGGLRYIFLSHRDEIGELQALRRALGGAVIAHRSEAHLVRGGADLVFDKDFEVEPGMWVVHTPGHSPGSACLLMHRGRLKMLFTGDHVLRRRAGVPAPLKFPWTWDWEAQVASARRLLDLEFDYLIPSHDDRLPHGWFDDARARLGKALRDPAVTRGAAARGSAGPDRLLEERPPAPERKSRRRRS
jgi:glyoxylase-like metal-dependent hydrolase (beta-lactamase superfamily II)